MDNAQMYVPVKPGRENIAAAVMCRRMCSGCSERAWPPTS